jgi:hypothetical protein
MPEMDKSLKELKKQFTIAAILTYLVTMKTCIVETDLPDFALEESSHKKMTREAVIE